MPFKLTFRCPDCQHKFSKIVESKADYPNYCEGCGAWVGDDENAPPNRIAIGGSPIAKSVDSMYREAEAGSEYRAEAAGDPSLKITNMKDHLKVGETAAIPVRNAVTQYADEVKHNYFSGPMSETVAMANSGPGAVKGKNAGLNAIQSKFMPTARPMTSVAGLTAGFGGGARR